MPNETKPDLRCTIEELDDLQVLPLGWVLLRRQDEENPDFIDIKYLGGLDPLYKIAQLEADNATLQRQSEKYNELIMFIATKHPGESRHETAMRYICERENQNLGPDQAFESGE